MISILQKYRPDRAKTDRFNHVWMFGWLMVIIALPITILFGLIWKSSLLFEGRSLIDMLFSSEWKPLSGKFGFLPFIVSSLWVTILSLMIAGPVCLFSAIYLTFYAKAFMLKIMQPVIDILAGIPSVIYGVWGVIAIVPIVSKYLAP
ncbi:MAG: hypothetical protein JW798_06200, partial [Prolixibacteraceae bacterium]|nr:hypothetical protein [Prolixibacteraceae bacterium]